MVEAVFFFTLGIVVGHLCGVLSVGLIVGDGINWSKHECRTCREWEDDPYGPTCKRSGRHTEARDTCDKWRDK